MQGFIDLYHAAFSIVNLPYTVLLILLVAYWLFVIVGLVNAEAFDIDLSADFDMDADVPSEIPGLGHQTLDFLNIGEIPVMFYMSIVAISMWVGSVKVNHWMDNDNIWIALAVAVPNLFVGLMVAKVVTQPFRWLNVRKKELNKFEGMQCLVTTSEVSNEFGECEIREADSPIKIFARTQGAETLKKGDAAVIVSRQERDGNIYIVKKYQSEEKS